MTCVWSVVDLETAGNQFRLRGVLVRDAGVYECFVDNGVKPTTLARMRLDVLCEFTLLHSPHKPDLMLTRRATASVSFRTQVVLVYRR